MSAVSTNIVRKEVEALESMAEDRERAAATLRQRNQYSSALQLQRDAERKRAEAEYLKAMELTGD